MFGIGRRNVYDFGFQGVKLLNDFARRLPAYRIPGRHPWRWMQQDALFRQTQSYARNVQAVPANGEDVLAAGESFEDQFSVAPGGFLRMVSGTFDGAAGFRWDLLDADTDEPFFEGQVISGTVNGQAVAPFSAPAPFLVPVMQAWPNGANLIVRLTNLDLTTARRIQLVFYFAEPGREVRGTA